MPSRPFLNKLSPPNKWILGAFALLSFLGFLDATYLTAEHYLGVPLVCTVTQGCEEVLTSEFATLFGIPIALFGALYYAILFAATILFIDAKNILFLAALIILPSLGFVASLGLVYVQAFVLQAWCQYCLISAGLSTALFLLSAYMLLKNRRGQSSPNN